MAGGKETPRQKMIGMMYLVLTALLAMNVSKEVLDSFMLVDNGLRKTELTLENKNSATMAVFDSKYASNPQKTKPFIDQAKRIESEAKVLIKYIEELKARTIAASHSQEDYKQYMIDDKCVQLNAKNADGEDYVKVKDEYNMNTTLLYGTANEPHNEPWSASELKGKLLEFASSLKAISFKDVTGKTYEPSKSILASVDEMFNYPDVEEAEAIVPWEKKNFYHNPLAAIIPIMTKLQVDVQNATADVMSDMLAGIEGKSYKFSTLIPLVVPSSNYILRGDSFRADVLLAAYDGTNPPEIYVDNSPWKNLNDSSAMNSADLTEDMLIDVGADGLGKLRIGSNGLGLGEHAFKGTIKYKGPSGVEEHPFIVPAFTVAEPALVISPTKMNVFYRGLPNPVEISVPGVPADKIQPSITGGHTLTKGTGGEWIVKPGKAKTATINVTCTMPDGSKKSLPGKEFRVKRIPDPVPVFARKKPSDNTVPKNEMTVAAGVRAEMENFDFDVSVKVKSFNMIFIRDGQVIEKVSKSNRITDEMKANMKKVGKGQKIYIEKIKVVMPDGTTRQVSNITLKVT